jgi:hypothetical protein
LQKLKKEDNGKKNNELLTRKRETGKNVTEKKRKTRNAEKRKNVKD